jgi:ferredoxin-like protein FixX
MFRRELKKQPTKFKSEFSVIFMQYYNFSYSLLSLLIICTYHFLVKLFSFVIFLDCSRTISLKLAELLYLAPLNFLFKHTILAIVISFHFCLSMGMLFLSIVCPACCYRKKEKQRMIMWMYECLQSSVVRALVRLLYSFLSFFVFLF